MVCSCKPGERHGLLTSFKDIAATLIILRQKVLQMDMFAYTISIQIFDKFDISVAY